MLLFYHFYAVLYSGGCFSFAESGDNQKRALILEFEEILIGKRKQFSSYYFSGNTRRDSEISVELIRYFFDKILCWDIETLERNLTVELLRSYKLDKYINNYICFDNEPNGKVRYENKQIVKPDIQYLLKLVYGDKYTIDLRATVISTYESILNGKMQKFPKRFFDVSAEGKTKACICLQHAISNHQTFRCVEDLYSVFGDINILKLLSQWRLREIAQQYYDYPIDYVHDALPEDTKDEEFYELYREKYINDIAPTGRIF